MITAIIMVRTNSTLKIKKKKNQTKQTSVLFDVSKRKYSKHLVDILCIRAAAILLFFYIFISLRIFMLTKKVKKRKEKKKMTEFGVLLLWICGTVHSIKQIGRLMQTWNVVM